MIFTETFNPSLEYVVQTEKLLPGNINRAVKEHLYPGGKGNKVSVILSNWGVHAKEETEVRPFLIKPNNHELGEMFGKVLETTWNIVCYAKKLQSPLAFTGLPALSGAW